MYLEPSEIEAKPEDPGMDAALLRQARDFALTGGGSGRIIRHGRLVMQWGDQKHLYDLKSSTKGIGITALGVALKDGKIKSLDDIARQYHPDLGLPPESNAKTGWLDKITLFHLATQTAGFHKPGGYTELLFEPGTKRLYSDGGPNWLAECVTLAYGQDLNALMFERVFRPIGIEPSDLTWRNNAYRPEEINGIKRREFGAGISANVDAMARIGYLYLRRGRWQDRQIIPESFVDTVRVVPPAIQGLPVVERETSFNASDHYGLLWWNNADGTLADLPRDAYWTWGLYDSLIVVIPSLDIVVARAGQSLNKVRNSDYRAIAPLLEPIARATQTKDLIPGAETRAGWRKCEKNPVLGGELGTCFDVAAMKEGDVFHMYFSWRPRKSIALVESNDGIHWGKPHIVLSPDPDSGWEDNINRPGVVKREDGYHTRHTAWLLDFRMFI